MQSEIKFLYYSPFQWTHLKDRLPSFPHTNEVYDNEQGVQLYKQALELYQLAEKMGFDWLAVGEEHMNVYGIVPNPCLIAAALSVLTSKAKICILGNPLPILNPLRVAEEYAMIDVLSNGRLVAGFPRGVPQNYLAYGISSENSKEKLSEAVEFVLSAWRNKGQFDWNGEYYNFKKVSIFPQPNKSPELVFSGRSPESIQLAVKHKGVLGELNVKNKNIFVHFQNSMEVYHHEAEKNGWKANSDKFLLNLSCFIADDDKVAEEKAHAAISYVTKIIYRSFETETKAILSSYLEDLKHLQSSKIESVSDRISYGGIICGSPDTVVKQIRTLLSKTKIGILGLQMQVGNNSYEDAKESLHLFGKYVKPSL